MSVDDQSPLAALARDVERIAAAARSAMTCPHHPTIEELQREIALLRETVAYLRVNNLRVTERLAPVVDRALAATGVTLVEQTDHPREA